MRPLPITYEETEQLFQRVCADEVRSILLVSADADVGKSTLAYGLAQRMAAAGKKVLFVDFNSAASFPVRSLAIKASSWKIQTTPQEFTTFNVPGSGLSILAAPPRGFTTAEHRDPLLIKQALSSWLQKYDYVVGDAPCLCRASRDNLPTNLLANAFDAVVLILLSGVTSAISARSAVRRLQDSDAQILGVVMNDRDMPVLKDELKRQAEKLSRVTPRFSRALCSLVSRIPGLEADF